MQITRPVVFNTNNRRCWHREHVLGHRIRSHAGPPRRDTSTPARVCKCVNACMPTCVRMRHSFDNCHSTPHPGADAAPGNTALNVRISIIFYVSSSAWLTRPLFPVSLVRIQWAPKRTQPQPIHITAMFHFSRSVTSTFHFLKRHVIIAFPILHHTADMFDTHPTILAE